MTAKSRSSVDSLLAQLSPERAAELSRVREVVRRRLPTGYEEAISQSMIVYQVPLARYPNTYNKQPLWYVALAAPASYLSLHLMPIYGSKKLAESLRAGFAAEGKRLNVGKACIRFQKADDLALTTIGDIVAKFSVDQWVEIAEAARRR
jgi:hypothetical protein